MQRLDDLESDCSVVMPVAVVVVQYVNPWLWSTAPESAVKFYTYERAKTWVRDNPKGVDCFAGAYSRASAEPYRRSRPSDMQIHHRLMAGGIAGLASQFAIYPMELVKTRLITQSVPRVCWCWC